MCLGSFSSSNSIPVSSFFLFLLLSFRSFFFSLSCVFVWTRGLQCGGEMIWSRENQTHSEEAEIERGAAAIGAKVEPQSVIGKKTDLDEEGGESQFRL